MVLRWDGAAWAPEALPGAPLSRALYKVWGAGPDDIYVVGERGVMWRRQGGAWALLPELTQGTLFTVTGCEPPAPTACSTPNCKAQTSKPFGNEPSENARK